MYSSNFLFLLTFFPSCIFWPPGAKKKIQVMHWSRLTTTILGHVVMKNTILSWFIMLGECMCFYVGTTSVRSRAAFRGWDFCAYSTKKLIFLIMMRTWKKQVSISHYNLFFILVRGQCLPPRQYCQAEEGGGAIKTLLNSIGLVEVDEGTGFSCQNQGFHIS